ncbi:hypothetical protein E3N88_03228 [Mikania micrantha]|uniref:HMA domain-containing protein n=1 Tax=Mikania micrantha TaxID=192012 RepID=A0A5N6Q652_9ASTR|nr:hypothetical protein E3N88_03228 [Mikania micrantha]
MWSADRRRFASEKTNTTLDLDEHEQVNVNDELTRAPMKITLEIDPFCNCEGCIEKVKSALCKLDDVNFLAMNPDIEKFTILTTEHPDVIKHALNDTFPKKKIILSPEINNPYPLHVPDVDVIAKALVTTSQAKGLDSVEYTQSNTFKL